MREKGTAYILALIVLLVITLLGLYLAFTTNLERALGSNEITIARLFHNAESGINLMLSRYLAEGVTAATGAAVSPITTSVIKSPSERRKTGKLSSNYVWQQLEAEVTPFIPISIGPCPFCSKNENEENLAQVNHAVQSTARQLVWTGGSGASTPPTDAPIRGQKRIYQNIEIFPWSPSWLPFTDPSVEEIEVY